MINYGHNWSIQRVSGGYDLTVKDCIVFAIRCDNHLKALKKTFQLIRENRNKNLICMTEFVRLK